MKEQEAIEILKGIEEVRGIFPEDGNDVEIALMMAISALEEIQRFRALGSVKEFKNCKDILRKAETDELSKIIDEWLLYQKIGKVEEIQEALEKQITKKPKKMEYKPLVDFGCEYACPSCGCAVGENQHDDGEFTDKDDFCASCGQKLDWSEI